MQRLSFVPIRDGQRGCYKIMLKSFLCYQTTAQFHEKSSKKEWAKDHDLLHLNHTPYAWMEKTFSRVTTAKYPEGHRKNCEKVWKKTTTKLLGDRVDQETDLRCIDKKAHLSKNFHGQCGKVPWKQKRPSRNTVSHDHIQTNFHKRSHHVYMYMYIHVY